MLLKVQQQIDEANNQLVYYSATDIDEDALPVTYATATASPTTWVASPRASRPVDTNEVEKVIVIEVPEVKKDTVCPKACKKIIKTTRI